MLGESKMLVLKQISPTEKLGITFQMKMQHHEIEVEFMLRIEDWRRSDSGNRHTDVGKFDRNEQVKFRIPFSQMNSIRCSPIDNKKFAWVFSLETPPKFFKKIANLALQQEDSLSYRENDFWFRQTDVVYNPSSLKRFPVMLKKTFPSLDLGRWISYRLIFNSDTIDRQTHQQMVAVMRDHNIPVVSGNKVDVTQETVSPVWEYIDRPMHHGTSAKMDLRELVTPLQTDLPPEVRYQLEVCLSHGYLNEFSLGPEFAIRLSKMAPRSATDMLETVAGLGKRVYNPMSIFESGVKSCSTSTAKLPPYCTLAKSATVTPTTIYYHTPAVEMSNRVVRQYSQFADRFLRVRFSEEKSQVCLLFAFSHPSLPCCFVAKIS